MVAGDLGGPAGHVAEHVHGQRNIGNAGYGKGLAVVVGFDFGEFFKVLLEQVGELPEQAAASEGARRVHAPSSKARRAAATARLTSSCFRFGHVRDYFAGGGVVDGKGFTGGRGDKLAVDKEAVIVGNVVSGFAADHGGSGNCSHRFDLECDRSRGSGSAGGTAWSREPGSQVERGGWLPSGNGACRMPHEKTVTPGAVDWLGFWPHNLEVAMEC